MVIKTAEPVSTREYTERLVKILDSTYLKAYIQQLSDNATHLDYEIRTQLIILLKDFEDLFYGTLGDWGTESVDLELNPDSKPFTCKYIRSI